METWQLVLTIIGGILILTSPFWRRYLVSKSAQFGSRAGRNFAAKRLPGSLDALSATLELQTDATTATEVINQAVAAKPKKATAVAPGMWHLTFAERDDIHTSLTEIDGGVRLAVVKTIEFAEFPQGGQDWAGFRERIVEAARARGITTREGTSPHLQRVLDPKGGETLRGNPACIWVRQGA